MKKGALVDVLVIGICAFALAVFGLYRALSAKGDADDITISRLNSSDQKISNLDKNLSNRISDLQITVVALQKLVGEYHEEVDKAQSHLSHLRESQQQINKQPQRISVRLQAPDQPIQFSIVDKPAPVLDPATVRAVKKGLSKVSK